jgi:hypothetical protein
LKSRRTSKFREAFARLTPEVQAQARAAYRLFARDPHHPSLHFERKHTKKPVWAARVNRDVRAVGIMQDDTMIWFWIGPHDEYERLLASFGGG